MKKYIVTLTSQPDTSRAGGYWMRWGVEAVSAEAAATLAETHPEIEDAHQEECKMAGALGQAAHPYRAIKVMKAPHGTAVGLLSSGAEG